MSDINKYAKIWDDALTKGIFDDAPKAARNTPSEEEDSFFGADFFGQNRSPEYDPDAPLNEVDSQYWAKVSKMADHSQYVDPLKEETTPSKEVVGKSTDKMASSYNQVKRSSIGKDQDLNVTQNWGVGGKEHFQLEEIKVELEKLESKLNSLESNNQSSSDVQSKIDRLKKQIDDLSDSLNGDDFSGK